MQQEEIWHKEDYLDFYDTLPQARKEVLRRWISAHLEPDPTGTLSSLELQRKLRHGDGTPDLCFNCDVKGAMLELGFAPLDPAAREVFFQARWKNPLE